MEPLTDDVRDVIGVREYIASLMVRMEEEIHKLSEDNEKGLESRLTENGIEHVWSRYQDNLVPVYKNIIHVPFNIYYPPLPPGFAIGPTGPPDSYYICYIHPQGPNSAYFCSTTNCF